MFITYVITHELSNLNMQNPSCIDLLLTNNSCAFQQTTSVCSGLSECHKLVLTALKTSIPKVIQDKLLTETIKSLIL